MATVSSKPVYCCFSDNEFLTLCTDKKLYYHGQAVSGYQLKSSTCTGVWGGMQDTNQPASVYLGETYTQSLNVQGTQVLDCTLNPNQVYLNPSAREITTNYNDSYIPIYCIAEGRWNHCLAVARNGDIYGGDISTGTINKICTIPNAYRCVIDYNENHAAQFYVISLDNKLHKLSGNTGSVSVTATTTDVLDVIYNRNANIFGGRGILALKTDYCLYKLDPTSLAVSGNKLASDVGLLVHQSQTDWYISGAGYMLKNGNVMCNSYNNYMNTLVTGTSAIQFAEPKSKSDNIINLPTDYLGTYDKSPNGLKYKYRVSYKYEGFKDGRNVVNYETTRILSVLRKILIINILYKLIRYRNF